MTTTNARRFLKSQSKSITVLFVNNYFHPKNVEFHISIALIQNSVMAFYSLHVVE